MSPLSPYGVFIGDIGRVTTPEKDRVLARHPCHPKKGDVVFRGRHPGVTLSSSFQKRHPRTLTFSKPNWFRMFAAT